MQMNQFPTIQILKCVFREGHLTITFSTWEGQKAFWPSQVGIWKKKNFISQISYPVHTCGIIINNYYVSHIETKKKMLAATYT